MIEQEQFWMVYCDGGGSPLVKHKDVGKANEEAKRIAEKTGKTTYVLCAVHGFRIPKPQAEHFEVIS